MAIERSEVPGRPDAEWRQALVRVALMLGGAALASYGVQRRDPWGVGLAIAGGALIGAGLVRPVADPLLTADPGGPRWSI